MYTVEFKGYAGKSNKEFKWYLGAGPISVTGWEEEVKLPVVI
jgi:hypothetical protein